MMIVSPDLFVSNEYYPDNLLHHRQHQQREKYEPDNEEYFLVENINRKHTKPVVVDDGTTRPVHLQRALGHLGEGDVERVVTCNVRLSGDPRPGGMSPLCFRSRSLI